jgi:hypothetical protein
LIAAIAMSLAVTLFDTHSASVYNEHERGVRSESTQIRATSPAGSLTERDEYKTSTRLCGSLGSKVPREILIEAHVIGAFDRCLLLE